MKKNDSTIVESFPPLMCHEPRILLLGTIPGKNSISANEYYYDNSNRMWKMLAKLSKQRLPTNYTEKKVLLEYLHVVLWDYYQFVERTNSTDKGILKGIPNDIVGFVRKKNDYNKDSHKWLWKIQRVWRKTTKSVRTIHQSVSFARNKRSQRFLDFRKTV